MQNYYELFIRVWDTVLWTVNNHHLDVMAESAFYKLGGTTLADKVIDFEEGGNKPSNSQQFLFN